MVSLGMHVNLYVPTVHGIDVRMPRRVAYTPDLVVTTPKGQKIVVEIKPRYPYDVEIRRCIGYVEQLPCYALVLLFNTMFGSPFAGVPPDDEQGSYDHADCVRGIMFRCSGGAVEIEHNVAYFCEEDEHGEIVDSGFRARSFLDATEDRLFYNKALAGGFRAADDDGAKCPCLESS